MSEFMLGYTVATIISTAIWTVVYWRAYKAHQRTTDELFNRWRRMLDRMSGILGP